MKNWCARAVVGSLLSSVGSLIASVGLAQTTELASVHSSEALGNAASSAPVVSADGRYVAFASQATNLVLNDTNNAEDVFLRDRTNGTTVCVSHSGGVPAAGISSSPGISADGRFVGFVSRAANLVAGDTNAAADAFVYEVATGQITRVSVSSAGVQSNGSATERPALSANGNYVAFACLASNLVAGDTNAVSDVFLRDRANGQTTRVSVDSAGVQGNAFLGLGSYAPSISGGGRIIAFRSASSNLVAGDTNGFFDIFVHDRQTALTTRASVDSFGAQGNFASFRASISGDGRFVAFDSVATNLVVGDTNGASDIFVRDRQTSRTGIVSVSSAGIYGNENSADPSISGDGHYVAFHSRATNLVAGELNADEDVFVHDRFTQVTTRESTTSGGIPSNGVSLSPWITPDGRFVVFDSGATNLVAGDENSRRDVFLRDRAPNPLFPTFCFGDGSLSTPCPCAPPNTVPNPSGAAGHGCANSFSLAGGKLLASGTPNPDTLVLTGEIGPTYVGFAFAVKGTAQSASGFANGDGVRCVDGTFLRFGGHNAGSNGDPAGYWTFPNSVQTTSVSGATLQAPGQQSWYQLFYRNAAASFCSSATTNWTSGVRVSWP
ncbi:MAG: hypothetical protein ACKVWV_02270 [Planctomycetota bacterium]